MTMIGAFISLVISRVAMISVAHSGHISGVTSLEIDKVAASFSPVAYIVYRCVCVSIVYGQYGLWEYGCG